MRFVLLPSIVALSAGYRYAAATTGVCSFYSRRLDGHPTAGGDQFDSNALTAARRTYPMGARRAAEELGFIKEGLAKVRIEQVQ